MDINFKKIGLLLSFLSICLVQSSSVFGSEFLVCFAGKGKGFGSQQKCARCYGCGEDLSIRCLQFCCKNNDIGCAPSYGPGSKSCTVKNYAADSQGCDHVKDNVLKKIQQNGYFCFVRPRKLASYSKLYLLKEEAVRLLAQDSWAYCAYCVRKSIKEKIEFSLEKILETLKLGDKCLVCLAGYKENDVLCICLKGHTFHKSCMDSWMAKNGNNRLCLYCRSSDVLFLEFIIKDGCPQINEVSCVCKNIDGELEKDFNLLKL